MSDHVPKHDNAIRVIKDRILSPDMFEAEARAFQTRANRPDVTVIDSDKREVFLVEFAVPFDAFIDRCYTGKFDKYMPLCIEINNLGYFCRVVVVVIGSLGMVHKKVVPGFQLLGMSRSTSKWLAKFLSVSSVIGSHKVWQLRYNDINL